MTNVLVSVSSVTVPGGSGPATGQGPGNWRGRSCACLESEDSGRKAGKRRVICFIHCPESGLAIAKFVVELPRLVGATVLIFVFSMGQKVSKIIVGNGRPSIERQRRIQTIAHTTDIEIRVGAARKPVVQRRRCGETRSMLSSWTRVLRAMCSSLSMFCEKTKEESSGRAGCVDCVGCMNEPASEQRVSKKRCGVCDLTFMRST